MPTKLCPYSQKAKYVYVARHPVSCFASTRDFVAKLAGPFAIKADKLLDWFCSDEMFWLPWPEHVDGWWQWSRQKGNVLFVHYEILKENPRQTIAEIVDFLGYQLSDEQFDAVLEKSSFSYMKKHEEVFEMAAPNLFSESSRINFMHSGESNRHKDVSEETRKTISEYCITQLKDSSYPLNEFYPDLSANKTDAEQK